MDDKVDIPEPDFILQCLKCGGLVRGLLTKDYKVPRCGCKSKKYEVIWVKPSTYNNKKL